MSRMANHTYTKVKESFKERWFCWVVYANSSESSFSQPGAIDPVKVGDQIFMYGENNLSKRKPEIDFRFSIF